MRTTAKFAIAGQKIEVSFAGECFGFHKAFESFLCNFETKPDISCHVSLTQCKTGVVLPENAVLTFKLANVEVFSAEENLYFFMLCNNTSSFKACAVFKNGDFSNYEIFVPALPGGAPAFISLNELLFLDAVFLNSSIFFLHSAFVIRSGVGFVFTAPSGVGKSTHAELWCRHLGAELINGDKALLQFEDNGVRAFGSPWAGSSNVFKNKSAPLKAIYCLKQAEFNKAEKMSLPQAFSFIYKQSMQAPYNAVMGEKLVDLVSKLVSSVPVFELFCKPNQEAAELALQAQKRG